MDRIEVYTRLASVFQDVFDREVALTDETTAAASSAPSRTSSTSSSR